MAALPRKKNSFFYSPVTLLFASLATVFVIFQVIDVYTKKQYTKELLNETTSYYESLRNAKYSIEERKALLDDERGREAFMREKSGFLLPGEEVYVIVDVPKNEQVSSTQEKDSLVRRLVPFY